MLYALVCLGIVWDGCPPPRRFDSCVKSSVVGVASSLGGLLLGWDFTFLSVYCAFVVFSSCYFVLYGAGIQGWCVVVKVYL